METIEKLMRLIRKDYLSELANEMGVNKQNNKMTGEIIFKGLMRLILIGKKVSLRMLEMLINQSMGNDLNNNKVTYSGISKRLKIIKYKYFECIYQDLLKKFHKEINKKDGKNLHRFDSTIINLAGHIIKGGIKVGGGKNDTQIKVSLGLKNEMPTSIRFCKTQEESSEDKALLRAINESKIEQEDILLFDRGISNAKTYEEFNANEYNFITRMKYKRKYKLVKVIRKFDTRGAGIFEDAVINLYKDSKLQDTDLRLIKLINQDGNEIWILSNIFKMGSSEIADMYKRRWDIEVFFKFIKQNLGYKHFISHSINGMKVYIYMILITALMFLAYKVRLKLNGFKIPLFQFTLNLEKLFIKNIIILSGGNFNTVKHLL